MRKTRMDYTAPLSVELFEKIELLKGSHSARAKGVCAMELVAWMAGEPHSDHPACASRVITAFVINLNDVLGETTRQRLKPFLPRIVGTRGSEELEQRRGWMAADWLIRVRTPAWLDLAGLKEQAAALRSLPEITDVDRVLSSQPAIDNAKKAAAAAWAAAGAAAKKGGYELAYSAARDFFKPTEVGLLESGLQLLDRMIELKDGGAA